MGQSMLTNSFLIEKSDTTINLHYFADSDNRTLFSLVDNQTSETFSVVLERQTFGDLVKFMKGFYEEINRINGLDSKDSSVHYGL